MVRIVIFLIRHEPINEPRKAVSVAVVTSHTPVWLLSKAKFLEKDVIP